MLDLGHTFPSIEFILLYTDRNNYVCHLHLSGFTALNSDPQKPHTDNIEAHNNLSIDNRYEFYNES